MAAESLIRETAAALREHAPFSEMVATDVEFAARRVRLQYFAKDERVLEPGDAPAPDCLIIRQGAVEGSRPGEGGAAIAPGFSLGAGDLFPIGSLIGGRPPRTRYVASSDLFCWALAREHFEALMARSPVFADFCRRRMAALMELSMQVVQSHHAAQTAQWRLMGQALRGLIRRAPVGCRLDTRLGEALAAMEREEVGAMLVFDGSDPMPVGIFTRQDVIGRVVLPRVSLQAPISTVISRPVSVLPSSASVAEAILLMAEKTIRHVPVVEGAVVIGMVSERDLFALQRRNLGQIRDSILKASDPERLLVAATDIREWSRSLVAQGIAARHLTRLISRMNDAVARRLVELLAQRAGLSEQRFCWLAFGSEGRAEQTIATDQDNGIAMSDDADQSERDRLLALGLQVNGWLERFGYPLCAGGIMAGQRECCLSLSQWQERFERWVAQGNPQNLLNASIFFDLRSLAGNIELGDTLRASLGPMVAASPRFQKLLSDNALRNSPPRFLASGLMGLLMPESETVDLKLHGTMPIVDGARLLALSHSIDATGTVDRLEALIAAGVINQGDGRAWIDAFDFLQGLRLRVQLREGGAGEPLGNPNSIRLDQLSALDRRILVEAFRQVRKLQQRLALDYP